MKQLGKAGAILFSLFGSDPEMGYLQAGIVTERIYPEGSGSLTRLEGCSYLYKGYPAKESEMSLNLSKDSGWLMGGALKNKAILLVLAIQYIFFKKSFNRYFSKLMDKYFKLAWVPLKGMDLIPQPHEWCVSVKEMYRVSEEILAGVKYEDILKKLRDIALMILENDTAYRFVAQDIIPEINILDFEKHPRKEIGRLFDLMIKREEPGDQREKWKRVKKAVIMAMRIPFVKKMVIKFFLLIDYLQIKLDEADWYFVLGHHCYEYQDVSYKDRLEERRRIDKEKGHKIPRLKIVKEPQPHIECIGYGL